MFWRGEIVFYCSYVCYGCYAGRVVMNGYTAREVAMKTLAPVVHRILVACFESPLSDEDAVQGLLLNFNQ